MLGHKLYQLMAPRIDVYVTTRQRESYYAKALLFDRRWLIGRVDAMDLKRVESALRRIRPDVVVNCIGIVKQRSEASDPEISIAINALFPHRLASLCKAVGARMIHISTDCVFSGRKGNYAEDDEPDARDLYGRTKLLGEVRAHGCLTLRTSMIGRELRRSHGLLEWFLSQEGKTVHGYERVIFSGFTTNALAEIIREIIVRNQELQGVCHVASKPISKLELLSLVSQVYRLNIQIEPDESVVCDRSLNANRFKQATGIVPPGWPEMIEQMHQDPTSYSQIRRLYVRS